MVYRQVALSASSLWHYFWLVERCGPRPVLRCSLFVNLAFLGDDNGLSTISDMTRATRRGRNAERNFHGEKRKNDTARKAAKKQRRRGY
jgi:hypothetical protein